MANLLIGSSKTVNIPSGIVPEDEGSWEVLGQCRKVIEKQSSSLELLSTIAGHGVTRNNSLRLSEDEEGHLVLICFRRVIVTNDLRDFQRLATGHSM